MATMMQKGLAPSVQRQALARRRPIAALRVRCEAAGTKVLFSIHRHTEYGQSIGVVGSHPELGNWDPKQAKDLTWSDGDNWKGEVTVDMLPGAPIEYKYILKRKDGVEWGPGDNKAWVMPAKASVVEAKDVWEHHASTVTVLETVATEAPVPAPSAAAMAVAEAAPGVALADSIAASEAEARELHVVTMPPVAIAATDGASAPEHVAISTMENIEAEELMPPAAVVGEAASSNGVPPSAPAVVANNIVGSAPLGAVAVGAAPADDPIRQYEEADKFQVLEVGATAEAATATAARPRAADSLTVAELKDRCKKRGLSSFGSRRELVTRLQKAGVL